MHARARACVRRGRLGCDRTLSLLLRIQTQALIWLLLSFRRIEPRWWPRVCARALPVCGFGFDRCVATASMPCFVPPSDLLRFAVCACPLLSRSWCAHADSMLCHVYKVQASQRSLASLRSLALTSAATVAGVVTAALTDQVCFVLYSHCSRLLTEQILLS
jgi:hypothetical protein